MSPIPVSGLDQAEAWEATGGILSPGKHAVTITETEEGTSSGNYPELRLKFDSDHGLGIRDWIVVIPQTYGKVVQLLNATGVPVPMGEAELSASVLKGRKLVITVAEQPDAQGNKRNRVVAYEPISGAGPVAAGGGFPPVGVGQSSAINGDDDLPF